LQFLDGHNGYINIALDLGLVGLFLFLLIIFVMYIRAIIWLKAGKTSLELGP
jgi:O-antigen ligase